MLLQLSIGTVMIIWSIIIAATFAQSLITIKTRFNDWIVKEPHGLKFVVALSVTIAWIQASYAIMIWSWAILFKLLNAFEFWEESVYFSIVSFTTLGFGDILLPVEWRLLSGMSAANGLLMFGFFTAFIVEIMRRIHHDQAQGYSDDD